MGGQIRGTKLEDAFERDTSTVGKFPEVMFLDQFHVVVTQSFFV